MRVHSDWSSAGFDLAPVAPQVSLFASRGFLEAWWSSFGTGELRIVEVDDGVVALRHRPDGVLALVGDPDLTDYHSPLGRGAANGLAAYLAQFTEPVSFHFDSLPAEAAEMLGAALPNAEVEDQENAFRIHLPAQRDEFWAGLSKKERHEVRRKRRRFIELLGPPRFLIGTADPVGLFAEMHRLAPGEKGRFMTKEREVFFRALAQLSETRVDVLAGENGEPVAAWFGFEDAEGYYLYNSAYVPALATASPGIVGLVRLVEEAIDQGRKVFDFLKGDEAYKLRLGAVARPLFSVKGET